jgi:hypothetical protein
MAEEQYREERYENSERSHDRMPHEKKRRRGSGLKIVISVFLILLICCLAAWFAIISVNDLFGFDKPDNQIEITVSAECPSLRFRTCSMKRA